MIKHKQKLRAVSIALAMAFAPVASAAFLDTQLTAGVLNTFEDQSREAAIDVTGDGVFGVGDVLVGFVRIDNKSTPNAVNYNDNIYAIFTQELSAINGPFQSFIPTTVAGLTLSDLIGVATPAGSAVAVYSSPSPSVIGDLITASPGTTLQDYFNAITTGDLELIAGFAQPDDFFTAVAFVAPLTFDNAAGSGILSQSTSNTVASFSAGMTILQNNTAFDFAENVQSNNPIVGAATLHELAVVSGTVSGAHGTTPAQFAEDFTDASGFTGDFQQCSTTANGNVPCGFVNNADFSLFPVAVPEPATLALLGLGLLGIAGWQRRLKV